MTQSRNLRATLTGGLAATALAAVSMFIALPASADEYVPPTISATNDNIATDEQIICPGEGETAGVTVNFNITTGSAESTTYTWGVPGSLMTSNTLTGANTTFEGLGGFVSTFERTSYEIQITADDGTNNPITVTQQVTCEEVPPPTASVIQIRSEAYCIDGTTPAGEARVAVDVPEGAPASDLEVVYGDQQSLGGVVNVTASGEYSFQGALPVGVTPFTVVLDGLAVGEGSIDVVACDTNTNPGGGGDGGDNGGTANPGAQPGTSNPGTSSPVTTAPKTSTPTDYVVPGGKTDGFGLTSTTSADGPSSAQILLLGGSAAGLLLLAIAYFAHMRRKSLATAGK